MSGGPRTVMVMVAVPVPPGPVAVMVSRLAAEADVGVPDITHELLTLKPAGRACDTAQEVMGPPVETALCVAALVVVSVTLPGE